MDLSQITIPIDVQTYQYHTGDTIAYVRTQNPVSGEWTDWSVVRS